MIISERKLRNVIQEIILEQAGMHRCLGGNMVPAESHESYEDICFRIEDALYHRDAHNCGTENRIYYNGLLKNFRKKRNRLKKILEL